jgi:Ca2+-binding EF-hand superfamily protein
LLYRFRKGYINSEDLKSIFGILGENVTEEEINSKFVTSLCLAMIKIAGPKSNDKINYKEFVEFFYKAD